METKEIRKRVKILLESYHEKLAETMLKNEVPKNFVFAEEIIKNGLHITKYRCKKCGKTWENRTMYGHARTGTCPGCNTLDRIWISGCELHRLPVNFFILEDTDALLVLASYNPAYTLSGEHQDWMDSDIVPVTNEQYYDKDNIIIFCYDKEEQAYLVLNLMNGKLLTVKVFSTKYHKYISHIVSFLEKQSMGYIWENVEKINSSKAEAEAEYKQNQKNMWKEEALNIMGDDFSFFTEEEIRNINRIRGDFSRIILQQNSSEITERVLCLECGNLFDKTFPAENYTGEHELECPHCHKKSLYTHELDIGGYFFLLIENWKDGFCIRIFKSDLIKSATCIEPRFDEVERHLFNMDNHYILECKNGEWTRTNVQVYTRGKRILLNSKEDVREILSKSCFAKSGYIEALGLSDNKLCKCDDLGNITNQNSYISTYIKNVKYRDAFEKLAKAGFGKIVSELMFDINYNHKKLCPDINPLAGDVFGILGVPRYIGRCTREHDLSFESMKKFLRVYSRHPLDYETFEKIKSINYELDENFLIMLDNLNISYKRVIEYMDNVYLYQCIEKNEAFRIWMDYLRMAVILHYDLKDNSRKFPTSLKKEHDVVTFAFNRLEQEHKEQVFREVSEKNKYLEYTRKEDKYFIKVPEIPEDIIEEATQQKNCVRSYIESVSKGSTIICFLRKKEEPDKSFGTIEVKNGSVVQLKGYCNSSIRDKQAIQFVQDWAKNKKIKICC